VQCARLLSLALCFPCHISKRAEVVGPVLSFSFLLSSKRAFLPRLRRNFVPSFVFPHNMPYPTLRGATKKEKKNERH
jgi:hypothetical protein